MSKVEVELVEAKTEVVVIQPESVRIILPRRHAEVLLLLLGRVGGSPSTSMRKHTQEIYEAVASVVGNSDYFSWIGPANVHNFFLEDVNTIYFRDGIPFDEEG